MAEKTLEFESPHFLHGLFADDLSLLKELGEALGLIVTTRDSWIKLEGEAAPVEAGVSVFDDLEQARRRGGAITAHSFRYAVNVAREALASADAREGEGGELKVADLFKCRLLGNGSKPAVTPRTKNQFNYIEALDKHDVVFGIGPAGTGKTYLAMAYALDLLKSRQIDRIMLTRPAVEAGEALGFLPGALEEKVLPYLRPLYDAMSDMLDGAESLKFAEKNLIEIAPLAYMRGRTREPGLCHPRRGAECEPRADVHVSHPAWRALEVYYYRRPFPDRFEAEEPQRFARGNETTRRRRGNSRSPALTTV